MTSLISAAPVATGQIQSLDGLRAHALPTDAMILASATQVNPTNQNPGSYAIVESAGATTVTIGGSVPAVTQSPFADVYKEGSMYFQGVNTSNINVTLGSSYNWGLGLTAECWVYYTSFAGSTASSGATPVDVPRPCALGAFQSSSIASDAWSFGADTNGKLTFYYYGWTGGTNQSANTNISLALNTWNHIAVSIPSGGPGSLYINGVQQTSNTNVNGSVAAASAATFSLNGTPFSSYNYLGLGSFGAAYTTGYIADARVVYGTALYTGSSFTVPSAPLGIATSGTTALLLRAGQNSPTIQSGALTFDRGLKQYMNFGPQTFNVVTQGFTAIWRGQFTGSVNNYERLFEFGSATVNTAGCQTIDVYRQVGTGRFAFGFYAAGGSSQVSGSPILTTSSLTQGSTYIMAFRYNPVTQIADIWINGSQDASGTITTAALVGDRTETFTYLYRASDGPFTSSSMNTFAVYNRALSNTEIYNSYLALTTTPVGRTLEIGDVNGTPALSVAGDGKVLIDSVGLTSNVLPWPPAAMTGYDTVINGQVYKARASNEYSAGFEAWKAFDKTTSTSWRSPFALYSISASSFGRYLGTVRTTDVQGTVYPGEWLQFQTPFPINLTSYTIAPLKVGSDYFGQPVSFFILASLDGLNWYLVNSQYNVSWSTDLKTFTLSTPSTISYTYFRMVTQIIDPNFVTGVCISEWTLYGTADVSPALAIAPATTFSTSVATPALTGVSGSNYVPQDFSSSGLNIPAYVVSNTATTANTVTYSAFGPFAGEGSLYFPGGTGAYVNFGTNSPQVFTGFLSSWWTSVWTIETWVWYNTLPALTSIFGNMDKTGTNYFSININSGSVYWYYFNGSGQNVPASGPTVITANSWNHIAISFDGTTIRVFVNGAASGSATVSGTPQSGSTVPITINGSTNVFNGLISNLRVTRGIALYTTSFTPPTGPLTAIQGTTQSGTPYGTVLLLRNAPAPGRVLTQKFSGANSVQVLAFPPAAMTTYATTLNAGYGQGTYVASASSEYDTSTLAWRAFEKDGSGAIIWWASTNGVYSASGAYTGTVRTVDVSGNSYAGEWLQLQLPASVVLSSFTLTGANTASGKSPVSSALLGSRDGTNWSLIYQSANMGYTSTSQKLTFSTNSNQAFSFYRFITLTTQTTIVELQELIFNGTIESVNVTTDGRVGIGSVNPTRALEVAGDIVCSGTVSSASTTFRNVLINGDMRINQRGISTTLASPTAMGTSSTAYALDRWLCFRGSYASGGTVAQGTLTYTDLPYQNDGLVNFMRIGRTVGDTILQTFYIADVLETRDSIRLAGRTVTMSFYYRTGSAFAGTLQAIVATSTGTDQNYTSTWAGPVYQSATLPASTAWTKYSFSAQVPINATQVAAPFWYTPTTATAVANDYFDITGVQLEKGTVATPFEVRPYGVELQLCQRYYTRFDCTGATSNYTRFGYGVVDSTVGAYTMLQLPVPMRTTPSFPGNSTSNSAPSTFVLSIGGSNFTVSSMSAGDRTPVSVGTTWNGSGGVARSGALVVANNTTTAFLAYDAEL